MRTELNGHAVDVEGLRALALVNYGHFTSMQVCDGGVRGLELHLARLRAATPELFGRELDVDATRAWMRRVVDGERGTRSLRVTVFSRSLDRDRLLEPAAPDVLVACAPARTLAPTPLRVRSVRYQREAPHIKHIGTFGLYHQKRLAQAAGYDDALFVDARDAVAEGSIWNVGFFDGERIVWPDAPALCGVSMQLLHDGLRRLGVPSTARSVSLADIGRFRSAFFTNTSCAFMPIARIDDTPFVVDPALQALLDAAMAEHPWQPI
ncbi:aminotransferase class IV family protein [Dokdonella fugitiva]|uniref:Branched-subunit amino acid aminotransferase/4-amino-4-deoxychorismate lyase n=1 Tax=Dokdonella fugitiva TaxID=328517 RepID=A0A4R2I8M0_9GAMM|nr:aminotransferase class IV family protein [Dokdonella fugitiva]TCO40731.1 branched-subunit amino acid aminotransferase/4-amino-4-deoxychorismate lyase [Dokdonella fugitiva]